MQEEKQQREELRLFINQEYNYFPKKERDFILQWSIVMLPLDGTITSEDEAAQKFIRFRAKHLSHIRELIPLYGPLKHKIGEMQSMYIYEH